MLQYSIVHKLFLEFFTYAPDKLRSVSTTFLYANAWVSLEFPISYYKSSDLCTSYVSLFLLGKLGAFTSCNHRMWPLQEMIEVVREGLIHMLHTREGARVTMMCLWFGTAKVTHQYNS